ncbi:Alkaline ceramidase 3 [Rhizophlyctis rosea]|nr:Alkaline ceramidase 3 [Rhizophlyctis rosea]
MSAINIPVSSTFSTNATIPSLLAHASGLQAAASIPFRGYEGYWGPVTSTLDWCEENYIVTYYLAELWNSISNLCFLIWPLTGMYTCYKMRAEKRFYLSYAALILVGTGSFLFHGTLTYAMQLLDELPMVLMISVGTYCHLQMFHKKPTPYLIPLLTAFTIFICGSYLYLNSPAFFQISFGILVCVQVWAAMRNVMTLSHTLPQQSKILGRLLLTGVASMLLAFALWCTDQSHCSHIQEQRNKVGYPFRVVMELHAWWHLLTGFAGYLSVMGSQYGRALALGRTDVGVGLLCGFLPVNVVRGESWFAGVLPVRMIGESKKVAGVEKDAEVEKKVARASRKKNGSVAEKAKRS